jgi:hypothetical protein
MEPDAAVEVSPDVAVEVRYIKLPSTKKKECLPSRKKH